jgi:N6-adenosine-specific RNA methylase IME4
VTDPFAGLPRNHFGAIYADPPWSFITRAQARTTGKLKGGDRAPPYPTMTREELKALPVVNLAAENCVLFMWACWPNLVEAIELIEAWGFTYKTCAFSWTKADARQIEMWRDDYEVQIGTGYWTRANSEPCLLATRGQPKRNHADVRQAIVEPRRQHSRKPDCVPGRIERLVAGPYLELFARTKRAGWTVWGNQTDKFSEAA